MAECIALPKAPVAILRERRVIRDPVLQPQPAKPTIGQIQVHFFAKPPLGTNTEAVADDKHADHQRWIDRWATGVAVVGREVLAQLTEIKEVVDASKQMIGGNVIFETEGIKQRLLVATLPTHHAERLQLRSQSFRLAQRLHGSRVFQQNRPIADSRIRRKT